MNATVDNDNAPVLPPRPTPPRPEDCCGSGCVHCIYVIYDIALHRVGARGRAHPGAGEDRRA